MEFSVVLTCVIPLIIFYLFFYFGVLDGARILTR